MSLTQFQKTCKIKAVSPSTVFVPSLVEEKKQPPKNMTNITMSTEASVKSEVGRNTFSVGAQ